MKDIDEEVSDFLEWASKQVGVAADRAFCDHLANITIYGRSKAEEIRRERLAEMFGVLGNIPDKLRQSTH